MLAEAGDRPDEERRRADQRDDRDEPQNGIPRPPKARETLPGLYPENLGTFIGVGAWAGTPDRKYVMRATGFIHLDGRFAFSDDDSGGDRYVFWRRVRLTLDGRLPGNFEYRVMWDQMIDPLMPYDFHIDWRPTPEFNLRVGGFKSPFSLERRGRSYALLFVERAFPTALAPNRELGIFAYGQSRDGFFSYDVAITSGAEDLGVLYEFKGPPNFAGRLYFQPFRLTPELEALKHFGVGFSWTLGAEYGNERNPILMQSRATPRRSLYGGRRLMEYFSGEDGATFADGLRDRQSVQLFWRHRQYLAWFEYTRSAQRVSRAGVGGAPGHSGYLAHHAWMGTVSYTLSPGDENTFFGVKPKKPFNLSKGHWGGATISLRYQELYHDPDTFPNFADPSWAQTVRAIATSFQWHVNYLLELQLDFEYQVPIAADPTIGRLQPEFAIMTRMEVRY